jgi:hypothetical protein
VTESRLRPDHRKALFILLGLHSKALIEKLTVTQLVQPLLASDVWSL